LVIIGILRKVTKAVFRFAGMGGRLLPATLVFMSVVVFLAAGIQSPADGKVAHAEKDLPEFSLKDPRGRVFTRKDLLVDGAVVVATAPTLNNKGVQEQWSKLLKAAKHRNKGRLVFLEDLSQSSFKETARRGMRKQSDAGEEPLLLIDPEGALRKKLGVEKKDTVVLVYDKRGKLVHEEKGKPSQRAAAQIWNSMK
jgi:hypothetical protein